MLLQWREELDSRFGLHFEILDKDYVQKVRRERGFGVNPWTTNSRFLISHRLLIDEAYAGPLADWLGHIPAGNSADSGRSAPRRAGERPALRH